MMLLPARSRGEVANGRYVVAVYRQPEIEQLHQPCSVTMTFDGLRSRWMMPGRVRGDDGVGDLNR
jgi:hypothetical protein